MANLEASNQGRPPIVRLISFGAGSPKISKALNRVKTQSEAFPLIDEVRVFTELDLDEEYMTTFGELLDNNPTGYGLWSWKSHLINLELTRLREGDVLIYVDAGVEINKRGAPRFSYYLDHLAQHDVLLFSLDLQQRHWTKMDSRILRLDKHYFRNQLVAGILMFRVSSKSRAFVSDWSRLCKEDHGELLKDPVAGTEEHHVQLVEHRHDQSILSKVAFDHDLPTIPDETMFRPWRRGINHPFLALRNTSSRHSWFWWATKTPFLLWHLIYFISNPKLMKKRLSGLYQKVSNLR
jgi:hypothetical protein